MSNERNKSLLRSVIRYTKNRGLLSWLPDKVYIKITFWERMGYHINLENPTTFNEKIQWLKLYDRKPIYTQMVDKYEAKKYVSNIIGQEYIIPTLGLWNQFDDIDFEILPEQFVLKCTHDSGGLVICREKQNLDMDFVRKKINSSLQHDYYKLGREWPYKNVKRRIIAEKYMSDDNESLTDYKFFCFDGEPKFLYISYGMENHKTAQISFAYLDWTRAPFERLDYLPFSKLPRKPDRLEEMIEISRKLSKGFSFLRVDLYEIQGRVYFSELTFSPCGGMVPFKPEEYDRIVGKMLKLPIDEV